MCVLFIYWFVTEMKDNVAIVYAGGLSNTSHLILVKGTKNDWTKRLLCGLKAADKKGLTSVAIGMLANGKHKY